MKPKQKTFIDRIGEVHITNEGYKIEIIEYFNCGNSTIKFINERDLVVYNVEYKTILKGQIKNPYHSSLYGVGYMGKGDYTSKHFSYKTWNDMHRRCYSENNLKKHSSYKDCTVDPRWHNFQVFAEWHDKNYIEGWHLDKDILIKGNKIYSPETCCFVPQKINGLFTKRNASRGDYPIGVLKHGNNFRMGLSVNGKNVSGKVVKNPEEAFIEYKYRKEKYIKDTINEYKEHLPQKTYNALLNYQVEITD